MIVVSQRQKIRDVQPGRDPEKIVPFDRAAALGHVPTEKYEFRSRSQHIQFADDLGEAKRHQIRIRTRIMVLLVLRVARVDRLALQQMAIANVRDQETALTTALVKLVEVRQGCH